MDNGQPSAQISDDRGQPFWKAAIFDLDGTLMDSYRAITASVNHVRGAHQLPPLVVEQVRPYVGRGLICLLQDLVPDTDLEADAALYRTHHPTVLETHTDLLPGAETTLRALFAGGIKLAVCSNKPRMFTERLVEHFGLAGCFSALVGPEDAPRPKPAPDMLELAMRRLSVSPGEALYVGDMVIDIKTARAAGVRVAVVATGSDDKIALRDAVPDFLLSSLAQIHALQLTPNGSSSS